VRVVWKVETNRYCPNPVRIAAEAKLWIWEVYALNLLDRPVEGEKARMRDVLKAESRSTRREKNNKNDII
jgi:hypothetical protein